MGGSSGGFRRGLESVEEDEARGREDMMMEGERARTRRTLPWCKMDMECVYVHWEAFLWLIEWGRYPEWKILKSSELRQCLDI